MNFTHAEFQSSEAAVWFPIELSQNFSDPCLIFYRYRSCLVLSSVQMLVSMTFRTIDQGS